MTGKGVKFLRNFADSVIAIGANNLVNTLFLNRIKDFSIEEINQGIYENVNLWEGFDEREKYLKMGIPYRKFIVDNIDRLTPESILKYMAEKGEPWESQVGIIINTPGGADWFCRQVNIIKDEIKRYYHESDNEQRNEGGSS